MTDRHFAYVNQIPQDTDILWTNQHSYIAYAKLAAAVLGTTQILNGFNCSQNGTPDFTVNVASGEIYSLQNIDTTQYGSLTLDNTHQIMKQGIILSTTNCSCPAPVVLGQSINYLIEISFTETDTDLQVLPYYNAADITTPLNGPGNSGASQATRRKDGVTITVKAGVAAATGTQATPSPDAGFTGAWVVTVNYGDSAIVNAAISKYSANSFILETLTQKVSIPTGDARWAQISSIQSGAFKYGIDTGTANTILTSLSPAITAYSTGLIFTVKIANLNTGATTINANSFGVANVKLTNGNNPNPGDLIVGMLAEFQYDGTNFQLMNPASWASQVAIQNSSYIYASDTGTANTYAITLSPVPAAYVTGMKVSTKIVHTNTGASTLALNGLSAKPIKLTNGNAINANDLLAGMTADFQYDGTNFQLLNPQTWVSQWDVQNGKYIYYADSGNANAYAITVSPVPAALVVGMQFNINMAHSNTGASTLNVNGLGAASLTAINGSALVSGNIVAGGIYSVIYTGSTFLVLNYPTPPKSNNGAFLLYQTSAQLLSGTAIVTLDTILFDRGGYASGSTHGHTPLIAGDYTYQGQVASSTTIGFSIRKNGSIIAQDSDGNIGKGAITINMNGSSDIVAIYANGSANTSTGIGATYLSGFGPL